MGKTILPRTLSVDNLVFTALPANPRFVDLTSRTFHRFTVIGYVGYWGMHHHWACQCVCGKIAPAVCGGDLMSGRSRSCGCLCREQTRRANSTHNMSGTGVYYIWQGMLGRCRNVGHKSYKDYGGRGIEVCEHWLSFENFYQDMGDPPKGSSLDRVDNSKGYSPENCKWSTRKEQNNNTRRNVYLTFNGKTLTVSQWAERLNINKSTIWFRVRAGMPIEQILYPGTLRLGRRARTAGEK